MSCCAPGTEAALEIERAEQALPSSEELWLSSCDLGDGLRQTDLSVPKVYCGACITSIEGALKASPLVSRARVNLSTKRVSFVWKAEEGGLRTDPSALVGLIAATGYDAHLYTTSEEANDAMRNELIRAVAISGFAAANIMLLSVSVWSGATDATRDLFHWISGLIAGPVLIFAGRFFYKSAWNALKHGRTNMDVPISLAITLSYLMSLWETIHHGPHAWFDATVSLLFFLLIGRTLDHIMRDKARSAITGLARLSPRGAMVVLADGAREYRPVEEIRPGDRVAIAAGERVPVDGTVLTGASVMDVSIVNGESAPMSVGAGSLLQAGTLSLTGSLVMEASAAARDSFLSEIIGLMEAAEGGRARYRRIADRAAQIYSPAVHLLALLSFLGWGFIGGDWKQALLVAVSVLIITCPCALGLAVPVVQVVAAGRLFQNGIMVKDGSAMERLAEADTVFFDKTGTLTIGKPRLTNRGEAGDDNLAVAAGLALHSRHPLSRALVQGADRSRAFEVVTERPGEGLEAVSDEGTYRLGNRRFALGQDDATDGRMLAASEVVLSLDHAELATFLFEDSVRPGAAKTVAELARRGFATAVLSGDRLPVVRDLAARLGIADWRAGLSPRDKADACAEAAASHRRVLMVGDGINDAPALAAAHVSMAPATAADIGRQAADFVFLRDGLEAVPLAIEISRRAGRLIRENFALAVGYNVLAVPIAIAGYATPLVASIAMSTSSMIVVVNALRLNRLARLEEKQQTEQSLTTPVAPNARFA